MDSIRRELGIPDSERVICREIDAGVYDPAWTGYRLEFVGTEAPPPPDDLAYIYAEVDGIGIHVWHVRLRREAAQAFLEARTRPGWIGYTSIDLRNLDPFDRGMNAAMLTQGLAILYPRMFRSRPRGTGYYPTAQDFHKAYRDAVAYLMRENIHPRSPQIADKLFISERTFYDYKKRYGLGD